MGGCDPFQSRNIPGDEKIQLANLGSVAAKSLRVSQLLPLICEVFPVTRDFPWANLLLFGVAVTLMLFGLRRAFASDRSHPLRSKIAGGVLATLSVVILGFFILTFFVLARLMPASHGAPQVGQQAPDFTLADTNGKPVSLSELRSTPLNGAAAPKGVLLIFYRGYW